MNSTDQKPAGANDQAFPSSNAPSCFPGMTLRDYFAAHAMVAIVTSELHTKAIMDLVKDPLKFDEGLARSAYGFADAMIRHRGRS